PWGARLGASRLPGAGLAREGPGMFTDTPLRLAIAAAAGVAVAAVPGTAGAAQPAPKGIRIDPSTGAETALPSSPQWSRLRGIAVGPSGTVYVGVKNGDPGIDALTAPAYTPTPLATGPLDVSALVGSGQTLYAIGDQGIVSIDETAPGTQKRISPAGNKGLYG